MADLLQPLREFNDSQVGVYLGSFLHTIGAILFLGGLVGYVAWHRGIAKGHHHRKVLDIGMTLTYLALVVNGLGGLMRTFETGHPGIEDFARSGWVRAISVKHVFLVAAYVAAIVLFERVAPRLLKEHKAGNLTPETAHPMGHRVGVFLVALGIAAAAILGAVTSIVPPVVAGEEPETTSHEVVSYQNASGQLTSTPLMLRTSSGTLDVPNGTTHLKVDVAWTPTQSSLRLSLSGPQGGSADSGDTAGGSLTVNVDSPARGQWTYVLSSPAAFDLAWSLTATLQTTMEGSGHMSDHVTVQPGKFYEINTHMERGAWFAWDWSATEAVHFNVHSHFDGEVEDLVEEHAAAHDGRFTNGRGGGYSLMWENRGSAPVELSFAVWGDYRLDSVYPA